MPIGLAGIVNIMTSAKYASSLSRNTANNLLRCANLRFCWPLQILAGGEGGGVEKCEWNIGTAQYYCSYMYNVCTSTYQHKGRKKIMAIMSTKPFSLFCSSPWKIQMQDYTSAKYFFFYFGTYETGKNSRNKVIGKWRKLLKFRRLQKHMWTQNRIFSKWKKVTIFVSSKRKNSWLVFRELYSEIWVSIKSGL